MRVSIGVARQSMGRPARMTYADRAVNRTLLKQLREPGYAPDAFANLQAAIAEHAKPCGVVAAVLQPTQSLEKQWRGIFFANVSDDAAHEVGEWLISNW